MIGGDAEAGFLTVREAARRLNVHENTIRNWVDRGVLRSARAPGTRAHRFEADEVERVKAARRREPKTAQASRRIEGPELADATRLGLWADTQDARHVFPRLLRRLLAASGVEDLSGRAGEGTSLRGWDLQATATQPTPWLPAGQLRLELGVGASPRTKAEKDYIARTRDPVDVDPREACFIFVTPRRWAGGAKWAAEKETEGVWRRVRVLDGDDLEAWLEVEPAVRVWISEQMGLQPRGVMTAEQWWARFRGSTRPALPPALFLAGREGERDRLRAALAGPPTVTGVRAGWREDAAAFVCASLDVASYEVPARPVLVVTSSGAWNRLVEEGSPLTLMSLAAGDVDLAEATDRGHHVIVPFGSDEAQSGDPIKLPPPDRVVAREAFSDAVQFDVADRLAGLARRSMRALVRKISVNPKFERPTWGRPPLSALFAPLMLIGAWENSDADHTVVSDIVDQSWPQIERALRTESATDDPPFVLSGNRWHLVSPEEAFEVLADALTTADIERWSNAVVDVLLEEDPADDLVPEERPMASLSGHVRRHSGALRQGLAQSLALLASYEGRFLPDGRPCKDAAADLVRAILGRASADASGRVWRSLSAELPLIAEAAPIIFLDSVIDGCTGPEPTLRTMFRDKDDSGIFGSSSPHTGLLWALETVCWSSEHLVAGCRALAHLAAIDPGGRLMNRPPRSLNEILVPWIRHTSAPLDRRLEAIDTVIRTDRDTGWKVVMGLWPSGHATVSIPSRPRFHDWTPDERDVPMADGIAIVEHLVDVALEVAGTDVERWATLAARLGALPRELRGQIIARLDDAADQLTKDPQDQLRLWEALTKEVERHRAFPSATWSMDDEPLVKLAAIADRIEPQQEVERYARLFDWRPDIGGKRYEDHDAYEAELQRMHAEAVRDIVETASLDGVARVAARSRVPRRLGWVLADVFGEELRADLLSWLQAEDARREVAIAWVARRATTEGLNWVKTLLEELPPKPVGARLLVALQGVPTTQLWELLDTLDDELSAGYWSHLQPYSIPPDDVEEGARRMLARNRPWAAVEVIAANLHRDDASPTPPDLVLECLKVAAATEPPDGATASVGYELGLLLDYLESKSADRVELAGLEWAFFRALEDQREPRVLYQALGEEPDLFVELVSLVYRGKNEPNRSLDSNESARASHAWHVLHEWRTVPGLREDGTIDSHHLTQWVDRARLLLSERDRADIGDEQIGQLLSGSPVGGDGAWPAEPIRDLIERVGSLDIENGLHVGKINSRGITSRGVYDGGDLERGLAADFRKWAETSSRWPRTSRMLRELAESYERDALREDMRARQDADIG
jgi:excisionase family DNA binding protein